MRIGEHGALMSPYAGGALAYCGALRTNGGETMAWAFPCCIRKMRAEKSNNCG